MPLSHRGVIIFQLIMTDGVVFLEFVTTGGGTILGESLFTVTPVSRNQRHAISLSTDRGKDS